MWMRQVFFQWLIPAAFVLPLWLFIGWIVTGASPWALLWVLLSAPIVLVGQLVLSLLIRARGTVRAERAASWTDVGVVGAWHLVIIALGIFDSRWWWLTLVVAFTVGTAALWTSLSQLWREARGGAVILRSAEGVGYIPPTAQHRPRTEDPDVIVVAESQHPRNS